MSCSSRNRRRLAAGKWAHDSTSGLLVSTCRARLVAQDAQALSNHACPARRKQQSASLCAITAPLITQAPAQARVSDADLDRRHDDMDAGIGASQLLLQPLPLLFAKYIAWHCAQRGQTWYRQTGAIRALCPHPCTHWRNMA